MKQAILITMSPDDLQAMIDISIERATVKFIETQKDELITRPQAAKLLGKTVQTVRRMQDRGEIRAVNCSGHPRYSRNEIIKVCREKQAVE